MGEHVFHARAPVRVDPAGGGVDCPPYCIEQGGTVVNMAIGLYAHATLRVRPDSTRVVIRSHDLDQRIEAEGLAGWAPNGELDLLQAVALRLRPPFGFELDVRSDAPPGSGLGSSGAVGAAVVKVFDLAMGTARSQAETAALGNAVEREDLGASGGSQDSYGAALPGIKRLDYHAGGGMTARTLAVSDAVRFELERRSVLVYTGQPHLSGSIHEEIWSSYALPLSPTRDALHQLARIGRECADALIQGDLDWYGRCLSANWEQHQRLHDRCSSRRLLAFYESVQDQVDGGKTCGAGGGGCILFLAREGCRKEVEARCQALGGVLMPFRFDDDGVVGWALGPPPKVSR
jgi:D-glycero-alpha-D-manno-heptose-7-phosphate kinase